MSEEYSISKKRILVVDDEPDFVKAIHIILEANNYEVTIANDGQEGLNLARKLRPDLIVLDLMLPKMDGYKVCRFLKFDEKYREIPIIMLTARGQEEDKNLGQQMGADAYIIKSEKPEVLLEKIKQLIKT
ncbi:MAG: response regulator [Candidatus Omnitrophota bacterium]